MDSTSKKNANGRYYEVIIEKIKSMIASGQLHSGDKLPSERELAEQFGVSRVPVREAIKILEYMGVLESVSGEGVYVRSLDIQELVSKMDLSLVGTSQTILDLIELRVELEGVAAFHAAQRRTEEDLRNIAQVLADIRAIKQAHGNSTEHLQVLRDLAIDFHFRVVQASKNSVLLSVYKNLLELLDISHQFTIGTEGISYDSILAHEAIYNKILSGDAPGARDNMTEHMLATQERLRHDLEAEPAHKASPRP